MVNSPLIRPANFLGGIGGVPLGFYDITHLLDFWANDHALFYHQPILFQNIRQMEIFRK